MKKLLISAAVVAMLGFSASAHATVTPNSQPTDGWNYGSGNNYTPSNSLVFDDGDIQLALRGHVRFEDANPSVGNTYSFNLGDDLGVDFLADTLGRTNLSDYSFLLTVNDVAKHNVQSFNPLLIPDNAFIGGATVTGFDNSEALHFGFMDSVYNKNLKDTYLVTLKATDGNNMVRELTTRLNVGGGAVPEPATWAMMILGFGGIGATMRRRQNARALA